MQSLEEVTVHIRKNQIAYLDFFVPLVKLCIEVHGEQHYKFTPFYHTNILAFAKAKKRDQEKKEWCEINNIKYVELPYNKTEEWAEYVKNI
jgi:predicted adenine nucleotide alpha hydrolase (AANH) superfamily ATPase